MTRPNVVLITADNQPATLLGCYGNTDVQTPHIDRMAAEGMVFRWAFAANGMCSPGRATLFTGLMPSQRGLHNWLDDGAMRDWPDDWCAVREFRTLPATLSRRAYQTALIGCADPRVARSRTGGLRSWAIRAIGRAGPGAACSYPRDGVSGLASIQDGMRTS